VRRILIGLAAAVTLSASLLITGVSSAATPDATAGATAESRGGGATPNAKLLEAIRVDETKFKIIAVMRGEGAQVYTCTNGVATFREPVATLSSRSGTTVIHGKGPFWASFDGSRVDGSAAPPAGGSVPSPDATRNIPWLRLVGTPTPSTPGVFGNVAFIQRLDTRGGVAPTTCSTPSVAVPYSATYVFWAPK
jgi:Protein of unknown function (DUF3455)